METVIDNFSVIQEYTNEIAGYCKGTESEYLCDEIMERINSIMHTIELIQSIEK